MSLFRLYARVLELLGKEARLGWILAGANLLLAAAQFAEPVLFGRIVDVLSGKPDRRYLGLAAAGDLGGIRPVHHRRRRRGRAARRPAGAPPAPGGADELFRAHPAIAPDLSYGHPFRPADEGDAERHRRAVAALARIFPRAFRGDPVGGGAAAAVDLHQLAARDPSVPAVLGVHGADDAGCAQDLRHAERGRDSATATFPHAPPTRSATSRWCKVSCRSTPRCRACA